MEAITNVGPIIPFSMPATLQNLNIFKENVDHLLHSLRDDFRSGFQQTDVYGRIYIKSNVIKNTYTLWDLNCLFRGVTNDMANFIYSL